MRKLYLTTLLSVFVLGTMIAALQSVPLLPSVPLVKASPGATGVRFYIWNAASGNNIYPGKAVGQASIIEIWVDSPDSWINTANGIVGYGLSIRVDPTRLEVMSASKIMSMGGFLEHFLTTEGDGSGLTWADYGYSTTFAYSPIPLDAAAKSAGIIKDMFEAIQGFQSLGVGAGGGPIRLCRFIVRSLDATNPSPLIITGRQPGAALEATASYMTPDGVWHYVDVMDNGWYISNAYEDKYFLDFKTTYPPVIGSQWHELWPTYCHTLTVTDWADNGDGELSASDQLTMRNETDAHIDEYHVDHIATSPTADDGVQDIIVIKKPPVEPEFPLGIGILTLIVPVVPIVYIWRLRKKSR